MDGLRGAHIGQPGGEYHIYHREDLWEGSKAQTMLHEMYEIVLERMDEIHSPGMPVPSGPNPVICQQAERFAAAALMQPASSCPTPRPAGWTWRPSTMSFGCAYSFGGPAAGRGGAGPAPAGGPVRAGGTGRPRRAGPSRPCCGPGWCGGQRVSGAPVPAAERTAGRDAP